MGNATNETTKKTNWCCIRQSFTSVDRRNYFIITEG